MGHVDQLEDEIELLEDQIIVLQKTNYELKTELSKLKREIRERGIYNNDDIKYDTKPPDYNFYQAYRPTTYREQREQQYIAQQQAVQQQAMTQAAQDAAVFGQGMAQIQTTAGNTGLQGVLQNDQAAAITQQNFARVTITAQDIQNTDITPHVDWTVWDDEL